MSGSIAEKDTQISRLTEELRQVKAERDSMSAAIADVRWSDDPRTCERIIRIRHVDLDSPQVVVDAIINECKKILNKEK